MKEASIKKKQMNPFFEVRQNKKTGYQSIFATQDLEPNFILSKIESKEILTNPTRFTIQVNKNQHIALKPEDLQYVNHSCNPNVFFDTKMMVLITLRNINCGEEIAFFYPSTEWKMIESFECSCGDGNCLKRIEGASHLTSEDYTKYRLSDYVMHEYRKLGGVKPD